MRRVVANTVLALFLAIVVSHGASGQGVMFDALNGPGGCVRLQGAYLAFIVSFTTYGVMRSVLFLIGS